MIHQPQVMAGQYLKTNPGRDIPPKEITSPVCRFEGLALPNQFAIFAAGAYAGRPLDQQIDQSGHMSTQVDVLVNHPESPVVLMLGAYEPTVWNIGWSSNTQIIAVFVSGYYRQALAGLESSVPTLISTYDNAGSCGDYYITADKTGWLNPIARRLFNRAVNMVYLVKEGTVVIGTPIPPLHNTIITSPHTPPKSYFDKTRPMSGLAGLDKAVKKGLLRKATQRDAAAWVAAINKKIIANDTPPIAGIDQPEPQMPNLYNAYVVLKAFTYPSGLYGTNSATFFVPTGIPIPIGSGGHSTVYDFNTLSCHGVDCITQSD